MNQQTNIQVIALATVISVGIVWVLSFFAPEFWDARPDGLEAALSGGLAVVLGYFINPNTGFDVTTGDPRA